MGLPKDAKLWGPPYLRSESDEKATRSYLNTSLSILRLLGDKTPFPMYHQVLDNVTEIAKRINLDSDVAPILNQMVEFGKRTKYEGTEYLQHLIQQRRIWDKKERPTQPGPARVPFRG
jgi:DNA polymerase III alpha subunit